MCGLSSVLEHASTPDADWKLPGSFFLSAYTQNPTTSKYVQVGSAWAAKFISSCFNKAQPRVAHQTDEVTLASLLTV